MTLTQATQGTCSYCGAKPGEVCIVTLAPEVMPLSVAWSHAARQEITA